MDTPFERLESEIRRDWQTHPVTQAFLQTLEDYRSQLAKHMLLRCESVISSKVDGMEDLKVAGGERKGLAFAIELAGGRAHG